MKIPHIISIFKGLKDEILTINTEKNKEDISETPKGEIDKTRMYSTLAIKLIIMAGALGYFSPKAIDQMSGLIEYLESSGMIDAITSLFSK